MLRPARPGNSTPRAQTSSGARIISPQKVDLTSAKSGATRLGTSQSNQNMESGLTQPVRVRTSNVDGNEVQKIRGLLNSESDVRLNTRGGGAEGLNGVLKNGLAGARPSTVAEGYVTRSANNTHRAGKKNDFKVRKQHSLYPTSRVAGGFMNGAVNDEEMNEENLREDREAVEDLERWDNEYRILAISKALEMDQKKVKENNPVQYNADRLEPYRTPFLNREMINLIDADEGHEKEGKYMTTVSNMNKQQKARVPQKSLETIMTEYNKKILNEILYARVSKQMKAKGQGKLDLDHATKSVSSDTVNNFKNLQHTIQTNPRIIEYDELYQKLTIQKNLPKSEFDFDEDRKRIQAIENDHAAIETKLKVQFEAVIDDIHKKKVLLNDLRMMIHNNNDETKALEEEVDELQRKYTAMENQFNLQKEQNKAMFKLSNRKQRGAIKDPSARVHQNAYGDEYSRIQRQLDEKKEQINDMKERIEDLHNETQKCQQKLSNVEREIKDLKFKKNQIRLQLKQLYVKILKNEETIFKNEASFITIIKNMWRINEEVLEDMFPGFLDKEALAFLIENARLEYELDQLEQLSKDEAIKEQHKHDHRHPDEVLTKFLKTQSTLNIPLSEQLVDVKKRLQNLKKGIVKMKRPVFIKDGTSRSRIIRWEELNLESDDFSEPHVEDQFIQEKINRAMMGIKGKIEALKEKEIERIFSNYINKEIDEKRLASLNKILISLFGKQNAEKIYTRFCRVKQSHDFKVAQNKTFLFSSTKHFSNSKVGDKNKNSYTLMLSYASNFRPSTSQATKKEEAENQANANRGRAQNFNKEIDEYQEAENFEVNYNYNLNYNYAPEAQNGDPHGQFYVSRSTIQEPSSTKSKLFKSGTSFFNKVSFKDSRPNTGFVDMTQTQTTFNPNQGRSLLKSAQ